MPAAIAIPLIMGAASVGASVVSAKMASNTAKKASQIQVDASNKAMDYQQQSQQRALDFIGQQQNRPLQPMGGAAFNQLSSRTGGGAYGGLMGGSPSPYQMQPPKIGAPGGGSAGGYRTLLGQPSTPPAAPGGVPGAPPPPSGVPGPGGAPAGQPAVGAIKMFPNGARGRWDGQGWEQI